MYGNPYRTSCTLEVFEMENVIQSIDVGSEVNPDFVEDLGGKNVTFLRTNHKDKTKEVIYQDGSRVMTDIKTEITCIHEYIVETMNDGEIKRNTMIFNENERSEIYFKRVKHVIGGKSYFEYIRLDENCRNLVNKFKRELEKIQEE